MTRSNVVRLIALMAVVLPLGVGAGSLLIQKPPAQSIEDETTGKQRDWFRYFYAHHASHERYRQYGLSDERTKIYAGAVKEFTPIESVTHKVYCPKASDGPVSKTFFYYSCRMAFLNRRDKAPLLHAVDYQGSASFLMSGDSYDTIFPLDDEQSGPVAIAGRRQAGMLSFVLKNGGKSSLVRPSPPHHLAPYPFTITDLTGDGTDDFAIGGRVFLSKGEAFSPIEDTQLDGRELTMVRVNNAPWILAPAQTHIDVFAIAEGGLQKVAQIPLESPLASDRPFAIMPLNGALFPAPLAFVAMSTETVDFYVVQADWTAMRLLSFPKPQWGEFIIGARGDFDGDGINDVWTAEQRWKNADGKTVGRALLLSSKLFTAAMSGATSPRKLEDLASTTLHGSTRYTDYDGIGASLSPIAGDIDGDGLPDFTIPGHRHMSETGALFVLLGRNIIRDGVMDVSNPSVIRILGRTMSQLAPPFQHYDAFDITGDGRHDIVISADNDLCSGLNAGAIYVLDGAKVAAAVNAP